MGSFRIWLLLGFALVSGCAGIDPRDRYQDTGPATALPQASYHTDVVAHDGTALRATVFQPALEPGVEAPVIIHTHGFGAFRASRRFSVYGQLVLSGQAAMAAWDSGYWVVSYDQRGFGDSGGQVHLMDPDYEVQDFISILDWADEYLPRVRREPDGDLYVGAIGESYGGAVQILASMQAPRLDAYLVAIQDGHIMPWPMQAFSGMPLFNTQADIRCGTYATTAVAMVLAFWDEKLKGQTVTCPRHCLTFPFGKPMPSAELILEPGSEVFRVRETPVRLAFSGSLELLLQPWDWLLGWFVPATYVPPAAEQPVTGGGLRPAFVPLYRAREGDFLAGVPRLQLTTSMETADREGVMFAGLGVRRPGSPAIEVIHEQFTPVRIPANQDTAMAGVVYPLAADETLGLVLQGFVGAYYSRGEGWGDQARVSGSVTLPLHHLGED